MAATARKEEEINWITFEDDEEALSLSDLPVADRGEDGDCRGGDEDVQPARSPEAEDFEFRTLNGGLDLESAEVDMCAADEVFFQGQILPLRPSVSSDGGLFPVSRGPSRCGSRSDSMDCYSSATGSLGFESSRSLSGQSSSSISRSQSTHSTNSASSCANEAPARLSIPNNFYAHPSPKPHMCSRRKSTSMGRKSTSSAGSGWGLLRLGLVKTPEIYLSDLRHRKGGAGHNNVANMVDRRKVSNEEGACRSEKKTSPLPQGDAGGSGGTRCAESNRKFETRNDGSHKEEKPEKKASSSLGSRLRCSCSPDDVMDATTCSRIVVAGETKREGAARLKTASLNMRRRHDVMCHRRTVEWLAALSVPKPPVA